jgi:hypothetical protein
MRGSRQFWIDDRVIDCFAPVLGRYPFGTAALAVYLVLARRADRDGGSWPRLALIAKESGTSERTVQRAIRLLEVLGLVEVSLCYEQGSNRQTSNLYTLLTPPDQLPEIDSDPDKWPRPIRRALLVCGGNRAESLAAKLREADSAGRSPRPADTPQASPSHPRGVSLAPLERSTIKGNTLKEESPSAKDCQTATRQDGKEDALLAVLPSFVIHEIGLSNRHLWAASLSHMAQRGHVSQTDLESWLRPASLVGRDGSTLIIGAPNAVTRDRIATRFLPAVREALAATIGASVEVVVVVADRG